jgi:NAD(P)H-flavin reductase
VKGPKGQFNYSPTLSREIGMIAGGTGITPMLQIIRAALKNPQDNTRLSLIYANVNYEDILLKKELDELADKYSSRFKVFYVLNNAPSGWTGGVGFVSKGQIETHLPASRDDIKILLCGMCISHYQILQPYEYVCRASPHDDRNEVSIPLSFLGSGSTLYQKNSRRTQIPSSPRSQQTRRSGGCPHPSSDNQPLLTLVIGLSILN